MDLIQVYIPLFGQIKETARVDNLHSIPSIHNENIKYKNFTFTA